MTDQELTALLAKPIGTERPEYLDRVDYLRQNKLPHRPPVYVTAIVSVALRLAVTLVVLIRVEPVLLLLAPLSSACRQS
jgi:hypothetical protein